MTKPKNSHVWVIDDDLAILEATQAILIEEGYDVQTINDPTHIKAHIAEGKLPQLIYLDILMSGVDGRDVAQILKSHKKTANVPIVMLSANMRIEEIAKQANVDGFLKKPFDIEDLIYLTKKFVS